MALEAGGEHYVQASLTESGYLFEIRDGSAVKHRWAWVSSVDQLIDAFAAQAGGGSTWPDGFEWAAL